MRMTPWTHNDEARVANVKGNLRASDPCRPPSFIRHLSFGFRILPVLIRTFLVCAIITSFGAFPARACEYTTMRDAGFDTQRDMHRLCVMGEAGDVEAQAVYERLKSWILEHEDMNVELHFVNVADESIDWPKQYGPPSAPPVTPVTALIGTRSYERAHFVIDHWQPSPSSSDLDTLADSPAREAIRRHTGERLAVLLYARGGEEHPSQREHVDAIVAAWEKSVDEWFGLRVVAFDRHDPAERALRSFAKIAPDGPDWLGVVFGRGKLMAPPLEGEQIRPHLVNDLLDRLTEECTCLRSPNSLGVDLPMVWTKKDQATFTPHKQPATTQPAILATGSPDASNPDNPGGSRLQRKLLMTFIGLAAFVGLLTIGLVFRKGSLPS